MQKGLTWNADDDSAIGASWFDLIQTGKIADWACRSARDIVLAVLELIPDGPTDTSQIYKNGFRRTADKWMLESPSVA
jgi:hypothetical protein